VAVVAQSLLKTAAVRAEPVVRTALQVMALAHLAVLLAAKQVQTVKTQ
jgi:hypothetical protein